MIRVLLIEDDREIAEIIRSYLHEQDQYLVTCAYSAESAMAIGCDHFDIILLDVMLPDGSGIELCKTLRSAHSCPILFISCIDDSDIIVKALEQGGDDYIVKPFNYKVLHARIQANLRRINMDQTPNAPTLLKSSLLCLDADAKKLTVAGKTYALGGMEVRLLAFFMNHPREYFMSGELYRKLWGKPSAGDTRTVLVHIYNLRKKLEKNPSNPKVLRNVVGKGYYFDPDKVE